MAPSVSCCIQKYIMNIKNKYRIIAKTPRSGYFAQIMKSNELNTFIKVYTMGRYSMENKKFLI